MKGYVFESHPWLARAITICRNLQASLGKQLPNLKKGIIMNIVIVYANAGGGHRSVALALKEAFAVYHPGANVSLLDVMGDYAPFPMNRFPDIYPKLTKGKAAVWKWLYTLTDGRLQASVISEGWNPVIRGRLRKAWMEHSADIVVSVYPLLNRNLGKYIQRLHSKPLFSIMITDLGTAHYLWFSRHADHYLLPTESVRQRALHFGIPDQKVSITGLPVSLAFSTRKSKEMARLELGLAPDIPTVLLVGGADGMGGIEAIARAIDSVRPEVRLVVVTGKNKRLYKHLSGMAWHIPVKVIGFTNEMHLWMQASDLLLSKAGPSTISEAFTVGLPIILTGYLPGQEDANLSFVLDSGAGVYQPRPEEIARLVKSWFSSGDGTLLKMSESARRVSRPNAAKDAADLLCQLAASYKEALPGLWSDRSLRMASNQ